MKSITEIRIRLCALTCFILLSLCSDYYPPGSGWTGLSNNEMWLCMLGLVLGCFVTNLLIALKKWWRE